MQKQRTAEPSNSAFLRRCFEEFCGFVSRDLQPDVSILDVFTRQLVGEFVTWLSMERGCERSTLVGRIGTMTQAIRLHPRFRNHDFCWTHKLLRELRRPDPEELWQRMRAKEVDYDLLTSVLDQMSAERQAWLMPRRKSEPGVCTISC